MMKSLKIRLLAIIAFVAMALGIIGIAGYTGLTASAAAGDVVGIGEANAAEITLSSSATDTAEVSPSASGQYFLNLKVTSAKKGDEVVTPDYYSFEINVSNGEVDEFGYPVTYYLTYSPELDAYYVLMTVKPGQTLTFTMIEYGEEQYELTLKAYLDNPILGSLNGNSLYGIELPATLLLSEVPAGNYVVAVTPDWDQTIGEGEKLTAKASDSQTAVTLTKNADYFDAYVGTVAITANTKTLSVAAENADGENVNHTVSVVLYEVISSVPELPQTASTYNVYELYRYKFTAGDSGFYAINVSDVKLVDGEAEVTAEFSMVVKNDPNALNGTFISTNNYPIYLVKGTTYYLEVTCTYASYEVTSVVDDKPVTETVFPDSVSAVINVGNWTTFAVETEGAVYIPTSSSASAGETTNYVTVELASSTYQVTLLNLPETVTSVDLHVGNASITLNAENNFSVALAITKGSKLYVVSSSDFTVGLLIEKTVAGTLRVNVANSITLVAGASDVYRVEGLVAGTDYSVTLAGGNGEISVFSTESAVIYNGHNFGVFTVSSEDPDVSGFVLVFENAGAEINLTVTISTYTTGNFNLNTQNNIVLAPNAAVAYKVTGVTTGTYTLTLRVLGTGGITVWSPNYGTIIEGANGTISVTFTVELPEGNPEQDEIWLIFENVNQLPVTVLATMTSS